MRTREHSFRFAGAGPLTRRESGWRAWRDVVEGALSALLVTAAVLVLARYVGAPWW
jgi:hypothetical protein